MDVVYLGLGGNIGDTVAVLNEALEKISQIPNVVDLAVSSFYRTTPVDVAFEQEDYVNGVCCFKTTCSIEQLKQGLENIEILLGKRVKSKSDPRIIDIDILFFGEKRYRHGDFEIPHPRWASRLFVLIPLSDLIGKIHIPFGPQGEVQEVDIHALIENFSDLSQRVLLSLEGQKRHKRL